MKKQLLITFGILLTTFLTAEAGVDFSGDVQTLKKNFDCEFSSAAGGEWKVILKPKDSTIASVMNSLELSGITKPQAQMTSLVMLEASGNSITYEFINQKYPEELSADEKQNFVVE